VVGGLVEGLPLQAVQGGLDFIRHTDHRVCGSACGVCRNGVAAGHPLNPIDRWGHPGGPIHINRFNRIKRVWRLLASRLLDRHLDSQYLAVGANHRRNVTVDTSYSGLSILVWVGFVELSRRK